jgi:DUF1707 SHOCT-like domain
MTSSETSGPSANLPQVRVSDAERESVVMRLNDATSEGRLTLEEFSERVSTLGSVKIEIPRGIAVDVDGVSVLGSRTIAESAAVPGAPLLCLHVDTVVGSVKVYRR